MLFASRFLRLMNPPMEGPDIGNVQDRLAELGIYKSPVDSVYGKVTAAAVTKFQQSLGIKPDGVVGPETWNFLGLAMGPVSVKREFRIVIDTEKFTLTLHRGGTFENVYSVAVGKPNTPTPVGDWIIIGKELNPGGEFGARWMRLNIPWGGYGIHGTDNPASIGTAASHGCIRMRNENVIKIYDLVPLGTPVKIVGRVFTGRLLWVGVPPGSDVAAVQQRLQVLKYYQGDVDGYYGNQTRTGVLAFQRAHGITLDGIVGPVTYEELEKAYDIVLGLRQP